jgi:hypothetical protein
MAIGHIKIYSHIISHVIRRYQSNNSPNGLSLYVMFNGMLILEYARLVVHYFTIILS